MIPILIPETTKIGDYAVEGDKAKNEMVVKKTYVPAKGAEAREGLPHISPGSKER